MNIINDQIVFNDSDILLFSPRVQKALTIYPEPLKKLADVLNSFLARTTNSGTLTQLSKADPATFNQVITLLDALPVKGAPVASVKPLAVGK
jgi:hypothetical protein